MDLKIKKEKMKKFKVVLLTLFFVAITNLSFGVTKYYVCHGGHMEIWEKVVDSNGNGHLVFTGYDGGCGPGFYWFSVEIAKCGTCTGPTDVVTTGIVNNYHFSSSPDQEEPVGLMDAINSGTIEKRYVRLQDLSGETRAELMKSEAYLNSLRGKGHNGRLANGGIESSDNNGLSFNLFPNPSVEKTFSIESYSENQETTTLKIYDLSGKLVKSLELPLIVGLNSIKMEFSELSSGMYFSIVRINGKQNITKLILQ